MNELKHATKVWDELQAEVDTLEDHKRRYLEDNDEGDGYEAKIQELKDDLAAAKDEYKKIQKDTKSKQGPQQETHEKVVSLEEENTRLKRKLIALRNGKPAGLGGVKEA